MPEGPGSGLRATARAPQPRRAGRARRRASDRLGAQRRVADHAALADPVLADLELRLDHQRQVAVGRGDAEQGVEHQRSEMNDRSPTTRSTGPPTSSGVSSRTLVPVVHHDPLVAAQRPGELAVADVDGHHLARAARAAARR